MLTNLADLNQIRLKEAGDPEIATRISQYELAYRMQTSVPSLTDLSDESAEERSTCTDPTHAFRARMPPIVCWHAGWPNGASVSFSCSIVVGINIVLCLLNSKGNVPTLIKLQRH